MRVKTISIVDECDSEEFPQSKQFRSGTKNSQKTSLIQNQKSVGNLGNAICKPTTSLEWDI